MLPESFFTSSCPTHAAIRTTNNQHHDRYNLIEALYDQNNETAASNENTNLLNLSFPPPPPPPHSKAPLAPPQSGMTASSQFRDYINSSITAAVNQELSSSKFKTQPKQENYFGDSAQQQAAQPPASTSSLSAECHDAISAAIEKIFRQKTAAASNLASQVQCDQKHYFHESVAASSLVVSSQDSQIIADLIKKVKIINKV
jgi:hypothetical protein